MGQEELLALVIKVRARRRIREKPGAKPKRVKKTTQKQLAGLSMEEVQKLLLLVGGKKSE